VSDRIIYAERLPAHPRLGRNVNHDSRSRAYALRPARVELKAVRHEAHIGILNQGNLGSCTGNAGLAAIYRSPYVGGVVKPWFYPPIEDGAVTLYSEATQLDPWPGGWVYPPPPGTGDDTGSDGLSVAKALKARGVVSGYRWAFTVADALAALQSTPLLTGLPWFESMFATTSRYHAGHVVVDLDSELAGGHELCVDEYVPPTVQTPAMVGGPNSWGLGWGDHGRWYLTVDEWASLLARDGDVTALVPNTMPPPTPDPQPDKATPADRTLRAELGEWAHADGRIYRSKRRAFTAWENTKDWNGS
jgi:hypothetical protein